MPQLLRTNRVAQLAGLLALAAVIVVVAIVVSSGGGKKAPPPAPGAGRRANWIKLVAPILLVALAFALGPQFRNRFHGSRPGRRPGGSSAPAAGRVSLSWRLAAA